VSSLDQAINIYNKLKDYNNITNNDDPSLLTEAKLDPALQLTTSLDPATLLAPALPLTTSLDPLEDSENCNTFEFFKNNFKYIAMGGFGIVFRGCENNNCVAIKLIPYDFETKDEPKILTKNITHPTNVEWIVLKYLRKKILDIIHFPYITYPVTSCIKHVEDNSYLKKLIKSIVHRITLYDNYWYRITVIEYVEYGDLLTFIENLEKEYIPKIPNCIMYNIIFQTFLILANIIEIIPGFRHNDLAIRNILVKSHNKEYHIFNLKNGTYKLKSLGFSLVFNDFDFTQILNSDDTTQIGNSKIDKYYNKVNVKYFTEYGDIYYFINSLFYISNSFSETIMNLLTSICPKWLSSYDFETDDRLRSIVIQNNERKNLSLGSESNYITKSQDQSTFFLIFIERLLDTSIYVLDYLKHHNFNINDYYSSKILDKYKNNIKYDKDFILQENSSIVYNIKTTRPINIKSDDYILDFMKQSPIIAKHIPLSSPTDIKSLQDSDKLFKKSLEKYKNDKGFLESKYNFWKKMLKNKQSQMLFNPDPSLMLTTSLDPALPLTTSLDPLEIEKIKHKIDIIKNLLNQSS